MCDSEEFMKKRRKKRLKKSEFRIRKHGFPPDNSVIRGKLSAAGKRDEIVQIKAFLRGILFVFQVKITQRWAISTFSTGYVFL